MPDELSDTGYLIQDYNLKIQIQIKNIKKKPGPSNSLQILEENWANTNLSIPDACNITLNLGDNILIIGKLKIM